ncbi:hypothetical protein N7603_03300 [Acholeplasma vituli]|uniref:Uncharacterized protein n=1 Tax=Paracholeplasma vituli TaxID=69473 RepID=A0ABT2PV20_9MOLU|nr:hypothetical protein [Paracholeplasma vituli]MCU0104675.1 hypothetical protein [Paracholeplasma vituli]
MFKRVLMHELKNIFRDKMYAFFMVYPIIIGIVAYFLIPYLRTEVGDLVANIVALMFVIMTSFMFGAITGFTLLDDQDDQVLYSLRITPIKVSDYIWIILMMSYILGVISTFLLVFITKLFESSVMNMVGISLLASLQAPMLALFINAFVSNKVEGFVFMKSTGIIVMIPMAALFLTNWTEVFLGMVPGFWVARIVSMSMIPGDYFLNEILYYILGFVVNFGFIGLLFWKYRKRVQI